MWPWGHLALGYLIYSLGLRRINARPKSPEVFLLALGTLLPDLVDKPLTWTFGLLDSGRSLGHSLIVAVIVIGLLYLVVSPRIGRSRVTAFSIGYLSHPIADLPLIQIANGSFEFTTYLVWPLLPPPVYSAEPSFIAHFLAFEFGPFETVQVVLFVGTVYLWYRDGKPGWSTFTNFADRPDPGA